MLEPEEIQTKLMLLKLEKIAPLVPMSLPTLRKIRKGESVYPSTLKRISDYLEERL